MGNYVVSLDSKSALLEREAGGKGASLAWLRRAGFQVPPGFVVTTGAFAKTLDTAGIQLTPHGQDWAVEELGRLRDRLAACPVPSAVEAEIGRAYQKLGRVAVRSSMVGEDALVASFAGQLDTFLDVDGLAALLDAVKRCWGSLLGSRLTQYLNQRQPELQQAFPQTPRMAVVVQQMVQAQAAGVAFSADPLTGQPNVIIEAARGLGDAVVQGTVQPDRYVVDMRNVVAETAVADGGRVLPDSVTLCLASIVRNVAERRGCPQDVEWAWDGESVHLLQCRPITSLVGKTVYTNRMVSEMAPGLIKPLVWHTNTLAKMRNVFGRIFGELLGRDDTNYEKIVERIHSRAYVNATLVGNLFERVGMPANFFEMMTRDETAQRRRPKLGLSNLGAAARVVRFAWRHSRVVDGGQRFVRRHDRDLESYRQADLTSLEPKELLSQFNRLSEIHGETQWYVFIGAINMSVRNRMVTRLAERNAPEVVPSDLIRGLVGLKALEPNHELQELAVQAARLDSRTQSILLEGHDREIREHLSASEQGRMLAAGVDAFLKQYGFLSTCGTDFSAVSWGEDPRVIWQCIGRSAASGVERRVEDGTAIRETARQRVRQSLNPIHRLAFDRLLQSTVALIDVREQVSLMMSEDSFQMRRVFLALGDHFVRRGDLEARDDIFYLTYDELLQLVDGVTEPGRTKEAVVARKAEMQQDALIQPPDTVCGERLPAYAPPPPPEQEYLVGIRGSSGVASGRARIVLEPSLAPLGLSRQDVLVVPFTDVGWTPLLAGIGGIVAETGGQLSHTAIVAREYGVPAVVSVKQATRLIHDGWQVTVDGDNGRVCLDDKRSHKEGNA